MDSRVIRDIAYDAARTELTVHFANGRAYVYGLVPAHVVAALETSASPGAYFNLHIRDRYPFRRAGGAHPPSLGLREALTASRGS
jgi:lysyl-tRNA synthetase class 2